MFQDVKININGNDLHLKDWRGAGDAIICVHGVFCNAQWWDKLAEKLSPKYRVITYDLPGRGDSATPINANGFLEHAKDIMAIIDVLNLVNIVLIGHSLGANIVRCFASQYPDKLKRMVLIDGGVIPSRAVSDAIKPLFDSLGQVFPSLKEYTRFMRNTLLFPEWSPYLEKCFYCDVLHRSDGSVISKLNKDYLMQEMKAYQNISWSKLCIKSTTTTMVLRAPQGIVPGVSLLTKEQGEEIVSLVKGSRLVEIPDSSHLSIVMNDQTIQEIEKFLSENI